MVKISETGHGVNLSNAKLQIDHCTGFGTVYDPSNTDIRIAALNAKWNAAKTQHETARLTLQQGKEPINLREFLFEGLSPRVSRAMAIVESTKVGAGFKRDARGLVNRIRGTRVRRKTLPNGEKDPDYVSNSHMSYVMRAESFRDFISLLSSTPLYAPNEADLSITEMTAYSAQLDSKNEGIGTILSIVATARIARNKELYEEETGLVDRMYASKDYVKGLFGSRSQEYKLVGRIRYTKDKITVV